VYGPRNVSAQEWSIIRRIRDGRRHLIVPGGGSILISRGFAENLAHGVLLAADNPERSAGQIYIIGDESMTLTNGEWIRLVAQVLHHEFEFIAIPFGTLAPAFADAPPLTLFPYPQVVTSRRSKDNLDTEMSCPWNGAWRSRPGGIRTIRRRQADKSNSFWETPSTTMPRTN